MVSNVSTDLYAELMEKIQALREKRMAVDLEREFIDVKGIAGFIRLSDGSCLLLDGVRTQQGVEIVISDGEEISVVPRTKIEDKNTVYIVRKPFVTFPNYFYTIRTLHQYMDEKLPDLYKELKELLQQQIGFIKDVYYDIVTAWIIGTYVYQCFEAYPLLAIIGLPGSGKTTLLDFLEYSTRRGFRVTDITEASFFRFVDACKPTVLVDEIEDASRGVLQMLRQAYKKGGKIPRVVYREGIPTIYMFDTFAPSAYTTTIIPADPALVTRCIIVRMVRKPIVSNIVKIRPTLKEISMKLWSSSFKWFYEVVKRIDETIDELTKKGLSSRDAETSAPIIIICRLCGVDVEPIIQELVRQSKERKAVDDTDIALGFTLVKMVQTAEQEHDYYIIDWDMFMEQLKEYAQMWLSTPQLYSKLIRKILIVGARIVRRGKLYLYVHKDIVEHYKHVLDIREEKDLESLNREPHTQDNNT